MHKRLTPLALIAGLGSGCSLAPPYHQPPIPIPSTYPSAEAPGARAASTIEWQDYFGDPQLRGQFSPTQVPYVMLVPISISTR